MYYYRHNVGDFDRATRHLTRIERSIYRDLMDVYFTEEAPLSLGQDELCRKIIARSDEERLAVQQVLSEFFIQTELGWRHVDFDKEIAAYHKRADTAKTNGKNGGRPKNGTANKPDGIPSGSGPDAIGNPTVTDGKANHKPITNNHKPETTTSSGPSPDGAAPPAAESRKRRQGSEADHATAQWMFSLVLAVNATARQPNFDAWADEVRLMREIDGRTDEQVRELFDWAKHDAFWCANIQSPAKLREKWDTLTGQRARRPGPPSAHRLNGSDRSGDRSAQAQAMARHGVSVPAGEVPL
jgi:uncharacterized protein YdaU (DUF1376 family)